MGAEGFQRASGKPFGRARRRETLRGGKQVQEPKVSKGRTESPLVAPAGANPLRRGKQEQANAAALLQRKEQKP